MDKFKRCVSGLKANGYSIEVLYGGDNGPFIINYVTKSIVFNSLFMSGRVNEFGEDLLIGALYHEVGHLIFFNSNPIEKEVFLVNEEYKANSEFFAFLYQIHTVFDIFMNEGDNMPLLATIQNLDKRIRKIKEKKIILENNSQSHVAALLKLAKSRDYVLIKEFSKGIIN